MLRDSNGPHARHAAATAAHPYELDLDPARSPHPPLRAVRPLMVLPRFGCCSAFDLYQHRIEAAAPARGRYSSTAVMVDRSSSHSLARLLTHERFLLVL